MFSIYKLSYISFFIHSFLQIIAERKQYHESTNGQYLNFENEEDIDDETKMIGGVVYVITQNIYQHYINN